MGLDLEYQNGQTPLDEEEKIGLRIGLITTRGELDEYKQPVFSWGAANFVKADDARKEYLKAVKAADEADYSLLLAFARS